MESFVPADDRLDGNQAISAFLGLPPRRVRHLIDRGELPVAHEGRRLVASKAKLSEHYRRLVGLDPG